MAIDWRPSATKHYPKADGQHAIANRIAVVQRFDLDRETGDPFDLFVGPARDGQMLEVFIMRDSQSREAKVFHVLHLRPKTQARAQEIIKQRRGEST
jgi:hypothetical protein